jgi:Predicted sugar kinase
MSDPVRKVALITHQVPAVVAEALAEVMRVLRERGVSVALPPGESAKHPDLLAEGAGECCEVAREELAGVDLCLVLGGDGTMLRALRLTRDLDVPVAGVNLGRVGYFATIARDRIQADLPLILDGGFIRRPLMGLSCRLNGAVIKAVNDLVVGRGRDVGIRRISFAVNGVSLFDVRCDALVVATPAGSTAYNLAVGGPVLGIGLEGFVVSYVAPHGLGTRSVVAAASDVVKVRNESEHSAIDVVADGDIVGALDPLASLEIHTAPALATLALLPGSDFYQQFKDRFV